MFFMHLFHKIFGDLANSADPNHRSALFACHFVRNVGQ